MEEENPAIANNTKQQEQIDFFQFKFLPALFSSLEKNKKEKAGNFDETKLINKDLMAKQPIFDSIDFSQIQIEKKILPNNVIEYIYSYGEKLIDSICLYTLFYMDEANHLFIYFTLEKTEEYKTYPFYVGGMDKGKHLDYGLECPGDLESFLKSVNIIVEKVKEKVKLLKLYYGENPKQRQELYDFEFRNLPKLFGIYENDIKNKNNPDEDKLLNIELLKKSSNFELIDWTKFKFEKKILPNGAKEFIYDFSEPNSSPLCRYALFYVDANNNIFEYITLEKTIIYKKYPYVICSQKGAQHKNFSIECPDDFDTFEKLAQEIIEKNYKPTAGYNYQKKEIQLNKSI